MSSSNRLITIYRAANSSEAHVLKHLIEAQGIKVTIFGESLSGAVGELPADVLQPELKILDKDSEPAKKIIADYESRLSQKSEVQWKCSNCGEENHGSFEFCWNCKNDSPL